MAKESGPFDELSNCKGARRKLRIGESNQGPGSPAPDQGETGKSGPRIGFRAETRLREAESKSGFLEL